MFRSLLFKAIATTCLGELPSTSATPAPPDPASALFAELTVAPETVPTPKLFLNVLHRQWSLPGAGPSPNNLDKCLYNSAQALADLLQPPTVDPPIIALTNPVHPTGPPEDSLCPEDKRAEKTLLKGHLAAAWSIRVSSSASFFNRAALLWLKQLQDRLPRSDLRAHQDLNKIAAALEYSADATLNATRFAARALGSSITSRRLLWLQNWQADIRSKWQLASAPYTVGSLFGPPLERLLVETRDKRKILPSQLQRSISRYSPYPRSQPFRAPDSNSFQPRFHRPAPPRSQHLDSQIALQGAAVAPPPVPARWQEQLSGPHPSPSFSTVVPPMVVLRGSLQGEQLHRTISTGPHDGRQLDRLGGSPAPSHGPRSVDRPGPTAQHQLPGIAGRAPSPPLLSISSRGPGHSCPYQQHNNQSAHKQDGGHSFQGSAFGDHSAGPLGRIPPVVHPGGTHLRDGKSTIGRPQPLARGSRGMEPFSIPLPEDCPSIRDAGCRPVRLGNQSPPSPVLLTVPGPSGRGFRRPLLPVASRSSIRIPPLPLIPRVLRKMLAEKADLLLIAPHWPRRP
ncbi:RNA-binding protein 33-like [Pantherophis guttatus]|uniref:RNA-binding protein 33-like n=1 Tax=Pantherophis guttatus TaxID=94885 RepID=A0A6P9CSK8_PANGU|nr:RNA-binding protein 33-like [Pantherophis guttatus]XP_060545386.1 RNA-binding protein 33-like [Pantherophis guttatus]XP_060545387.1 RNA-binding protein 33-like [Pantherophis guttatus]